MTTAAPRRSLDPPSSIDFPPHALHNPHARVADLVAARSHVRRVSSDSHSPSSPRITRRMPVPILLEAFPAPPSHIPGPPTNGRPNPSPLASATSWSASVPVTSPATTNAIFPSNSNPISPCSPKSIVALLPLSNPPPSSPPTGPLPPIPGSSSVAADPNTSQRALHAGTSPAVTGVESQRPRLSLDVNEPVRGRGRQGSLSSLRHPTYPVGRPSEAIADRPVQGSRPPPPAPPPSVPLPAPPIFDSVAGRKSHDVSRGASPDVVRSSLPRVSAAPPAGTDNKLDVEDSIANVDMSDLNALKSDNEGEVDDQASRAFPRFPLLPRSQPQSPTDPPSSSVPSYVHPPRKPRASTLHSGASENASTRQRAMSPEITQIITATPRPRKRSMPSRSRDPSSTRSRKQSSKSQNGGDVPAMPPVPTSSCAVKSSVRKATRRSGGDDGAGDDEGNDSDSSLDLHTPLPQLMLRHGMLSPHSKLLPRAEADGTRLSIMSNVTSSSYVSSASNFSLMSTTSTSSKHPKDARDTAQRRHRHRDGKMLKGGVGLTTGLGWSDSEDEDAPSQLTRRVSTLVLSRRASSSSVASYRSTHSQPNPSLPLSRSISHNVLREVDEQGDTHGADELGLSHRFSLATRSLPSRSKPISRVGSGRSTGSSFARYSTHSTSSAASAGYRTRAGSDSSTRAPSQTDGVAFSDGQIGLMPGIREQDDGITPTRAAFERTSNGSLNGGSGPDPHTPSSTASSASMSYPATPESCEENPPLHPVYNQDKVLPALPPGARPKYPSNLSLRSPSGLQRPRTFSNASSASNSSMLGVPSADARGRTASPTSTPRQILAERPPKASIPAVSPRPNGIPRPTLTIPKSPLPPSSALLQSTMPLSASSVNPSQGYTPRPLRLASRSSSLPSPSSTTNFAPHPPPNQMELNQATSKALQPGEQPQRPGQVLAYNRNVHDQLKLRALSLNTSVNRPPGPVASSGSTQILVAPSPGNGSSSNSTQSTPITAQSQSPLPSPSLGGSPRPRPRTGTGMMYRNNLSVGSAAASRIRVPTTVPR